MSDRSRGDGWWEAADGKWYPPELLDSPRQQWPTTELTPVVPTRESTTVPFGTAAQVVIAVASLMFAGVGFSGLWFASAVRDAGDTWIDDRVPLSGEELWVSFTAISLIALIVGAVTVIVWAYRASKAMDGRGASDRRWTPGWAIGAWFIPFANLILPRLVFSELEKCASEPYAGEPIGSGWKKRSRFTVGDVWWFLWLAGNVVSSVGTFGPDPLADSARYATSLTIGSVGSFLLATAGVVLILEIREIVAAASR